MKTMSLLQITEDYIRNGREKMSLKEFVKSVRNKEKEEENRLLKLLEKYSGTIVLTRTEVIEEIKTSVVNAMKDVFKFNDLTNQNQEVFFILESIIFKNDERLKTYHNMNINKKLDKVIEHSLTLTKEFKKFFYQKLLSVRYDLEENKNSDEDLDDRNIESNTNISQHLDISIEVYNTVKELISELLGREEEVINYVIENSLLKYMSNEYSSFQKTTEIDTEYFIFIS